MHLFYYFFICCVVVQWAPAVLVPPVVSTRTSAKTRRCARTALAASTCRTRGASAASVRRDGRGGIVMKAPQFCSAEKILSLCLSSVFCHC